MRISDWSSDVCSSDLKDLTPEEMQVIQKGAADGVTLDKVSWKTDLSGGIQRVAVKHGCAPFGNGKARAVAWNFPDPVPVHREPLHTPRRDLVKDYPTYKDRRDFRQTGRASCRERVCQYV